MTEPVEECPNCRSRTQYARDKVSAGGSHGPDLLPRVGRMRGLLSARMTVVVCGDCGLVRLFADAEARAKLAESSSWRRL